MVEIRCTQTVWQQLCRELLARRDVETKVFLLCKAVVQRGNVALLPREVIPVPRSAYEVRRAGLVRVRREFVHRLLQRCAAENLSLVEAHTHLTRQHVAFSALDMRRDAAKFRATECLTPPFLHAALVFSLDMCFQGHLWNRERQRMMRIERLKILSPTSLQFRFASDTVQTPLAEAQREVLDRQIRAFGEAGQRILSGLTVALVGAGGLGSLIAYEMALLGVGRLILVDPDRLEWSNTNRMFGVSRKQVEASIPKVFALAQNLPRIGSGCTQVIPLARSVSDRAVWKRLALADVLIGTTDSAAARHFLNLLSVAFLVPYLDAGVGIVAKGGRVENGGGQVRTVIPGSGFCLHCLGIDVDKVIQENLTPEEREARRQAGYIVGEQVPNPQVAFLNGVVANLLLWEFVKMTTGAGEVTPYVYYDLCRQQLFPAAADRRDSCFTCSPSGLLAGGVEAVETFFPSRGKQTSHIPSAPRRHPEEEEEPLPSPAEKVAVLHIAEEEPEKVETVPEPEPAVPARPDVPEADRRAPRGVEFEFTVRLRLGPSRRAGGGETQSSHQ